MLPKKGAVPMKRGILDLIKGLPGDLLNSKETERAVRSAVGRATPIPGMAVMILEAHGYDGLKFIEGLVYPLEIAPEGRALLAYVACNLHRPHGSLPAILDYRCRLESGEQPSVILKSLHLSQK